MSIKPYANNDQRFFSLKYISLTVMFPVMSMLPHVTGHEDIVSMVFLPEDPGTKNTSNTLNKYVS